MGTPDARAFMLRHRWRLLFLAALIATTVAVYGLGLQRYLSLAWLHSREDALGQMYARQPLLWSLAYFALYVVITGLSLPLATAVTLIAGPVLGLLWGSVLVTFAAAIGATLSFLAARYLFRDAIQTRFARQLSAINRGIEREGAYYLFLLRLIPAFPFFVINLVMGVTPMRTRTYFLVSLIGMIPGNILYVNAGVQLGKVKSIPALFSPALIVSLVGLGLFPLLVRKAVEFRRTRRGKQEQSA